ncbi:hypothetical protein [Actinomadura bangladeshensis]|uniref:Uncharacterized protein n=1 Tax=Actinomadura bangladeshensis TaxID=453573 RepID=A0A6L9QEP3_9ACTN|nr:hypothetical protein [Actinomadura bangladeshensis]NEA22644.1 hypothetical protein [Actinomadura bangladeshensis]
MSRYAATTAVSSEHRRAEIERTLRRYGADGFAYATQGRRAMVEFAMTGRRVRFTLTLPDPSDERFTLTPTGRDRTQAAAEREYEQAVRQSWAALALVIKAKLEAIEAGISTLDAEFLAGIVLPDGSTVGERTVPQIDAAYAGSTLPALLPGGAR